MIISLQQSRPTILVEYLVRKNKDKIKADGESARNVQRAQEQRFEAEVRWTLQTYHVLYTQAKPQLQYTHAHMKLFDHKYIPVFVVCSHSSLNI